MPPNDNRRPGVVSRNGGDDYGNSANVIRFPTKLKTDRNSPFDKLTAALVLKRHREGTLDPAVVEALLAGVGLRPCPLPAAQQGRAPVGPTGGGMREN
jgi:hypothetical protein